MNPPWSNPSRLSVKGIGLRGPTDGRVTDNRAKGVPEDHRRLHVAQTYVWKGGVMFKYHNAQLQCGTRLTNRTVPHTERLTTHSVPPSPL